MRLAWLRQWTFSLPFALRVRLGFDHDKALALWRSAQREIDRRYRRLARAARIADPRGGSLHFDRLEPAARACIQAHAEHLIMLHGADVAEMLAALGDRRDILLLEAQSLVQKKKMAGSLLAELVGGNGYRAMAFDVVQLVGAFRQGWASIAPLTPVTSIELDQAEALANAVVTTLGENAQADSSASPSADLRRRAYTYFVQTYDEVRRAISYLRSEVGDADDIAPALFTGRSTRRSHDDTPDVGTEDTVPVVTPTNGAGPVTPGMPGGSPFVSP